MLLPFKLVNKIASKEDFLLRVGIGFTLLWAGYRSILNPTDWIGFVPNWVEPFLAKDVFLQAHGFGELILGVLLIVGVLPAWLSFLAFLDFASILIFYGIDDITFRDVGLAVAAFVLFVRQAKR